ncbi:MAG: tyrosine-type recombinase/integrase [Acidobacteriota bacterium]|nr:tyrosine-type recombinase/integrase [Acidobacteriota bacterium]
MIFEQAIQDFLFHCQYEKNLAEKTLSAYRTDLTQFNQYILAGRHSRKIGEIGKETLRAYLKHLSNLAGPKTVKRKFATLNALFHFLEMEDSIVVSPFRKLQIRIILEQRLPHVLTRADIQQLWRYLYQKAGRIGANPKPRERLLLRDVAIFEMLFATGMRVAEVAGLTRDDVDLEEGTVRVFGKGRRERLIPICEPEVLSCLARYRQLTADRPSRSFFMNYKGQSMTEEAIRLLVKKHTARAGLEKKVTPHTFRHTVATLLLENGVNMRYIQALLGHSNISTTQIYARVNALAQREVLGKQHPRNRIITGMDGNTPAPAYPSAVFLPT